MGKPSRYKALHGGRGGGKSHFFATEVLVRCLAKTTRVVCIREIQVSIRDSVKQLLVDKIHELNLEYAFEILSTEIRSKINDSLIIFRGMSGVTSDSIKSLEGSDVCWVEEAQTLSQYSLDLLRPTIRKEGSELFFSWNPRHPSDPVDKFFRGPGCPKDAIVVQINYDENPALPVVLRQEIDEDRINRPDDFHHIWEGGYQKISEGAYYAKQLADMESEGHLWTGRFDPRLPVHTSWDIGIRDFTAIWFWQTTMEHTTVVDFFECQGQGLQQIVAQALPELNPDLDAAAERCIDLGRVHPFEYGKHFYPHDVANREWGAGGRSRYEILHGVGVKPIVTGLAQKPVTRVSAVRTLLPKTRFVHTERIAFGVDRLRNYRRRWNEAMQTYTDVLHDDASHAADAFGQYAVECPLVTLPKLPAEVFDEPAIEGTADGKMKVTLDIKSYLQRKEREARWQA